jgi:DNA-directed RNA polymerase specialized sigma24 family protein
MRFSNTPILPYVLSGLDLTDLEETLIDPSEPAELLSETFYTKLFEFINPGDERVITILKSNGLSAKEIAWVLGKTVPEVNSIVLVIKKRIAKKYLTKEQKKQYLGK